MGNFADSCSPLSHFYGTGARPQPFRCPGSSRDNPVTHCRFVRNFLHFRLTHHTNIFGLVALSVIVYLFIQGWQLLVETR